MHKVFIPEPIPLVPLVPFLTELPQGGGKLFQNFPPDAYKGLFEKVSDIKEADVIMVPHEYAHLRGHAIYLSRCQEEARSVHKPLLISAYQDDPRPLVLDNTIILRPSAYRTKLGESEILMPAYVEDIGVEGGIQFLPKGEKPIVAFAGKADFSGFKEHARYLIRNLLLLHGPHKQGLYFRRKSLAALANDSRITLHTIIRRHFSAHRNTIELPPAQAREEYIRSIQGAHFTLAPRGDGNYSLRFYETLALGRIPILIDTDMPLPLEDQIDYSSCIVRVPWQDIEHIGDYVMRFFDSRSDSEWVETQRQARTIFESHLYMPRFFSHFFTHILSERLRALH